MMFGRSVLMSKIPSPSDIQLSNDLKDLEQQARTFKEHFVEINYEFDGMLQRLEQILSITTKAVNAYGMHDKTELSKQLVVLSNCLDDYRKK